MNGNNLPIAQTLRTTAGAAAAVARVRHEEYDISLVNTLANLTADPESWHCLRDAGIVDLFLDMILRKPDGSARLSPTSVPSWALPLQGLFNGLVGIQHSAGGFQVPENREATLKMLKESPSVCRLLHDEKVTICGSEAHKERLRGFVVLWIQAIWNASSMLGLDIRKDLKASHIVRLATCCWVFASSPELRSRAANALQEVVEPTKVDINEVVASAGSAQKVVHAIYITLQNPDVIDECLANNMSLLTIFTGQTVHLELLRRFSEMRTHHAGIVAVRRQLGRPGNAESWRVLEYSAMTIVCVALAIIPAVSGADSDGYYVTRNIVNEASAPTEELIGLIEHNSLVPLLGGTLLRCAQASRQSASWSSLITLLKHTCTCTSQTCRIRTSPAYISALRTHLSYRWWPIIQKLRTAFTSARPELENEWVILGRMAGLDETTESQKHARGDGIEGCWSVECIRHVDPAGNSALQQCSGCKKAKYCTIECQTKDWKGHKKRCRGV